MMAYLARCPFPAWLRTGLIPLLLLMLLTASFGISYNAEPEQGPNNIERYEHKMAQPARVHPPVLKSVPGSRIAHHGNIAAGQPEIPAPVSCVLLIPIIYITLKRLLLHPLKYTSNYVSLLPDLSLHEPKENPLHLTEKSVYRTYFFSY